MKFTEKIKQKRGLLINVLTLVVVAIVAVIFINVGVTKSTKQSSSAAEGDITVKVEVCCPQIFEEENYKQLDQRVKDSGLLDSGETLVSCEVSLEEGSDMMDALTAACEKNELEIDVGRSELYGDYLSGIGGLVNLKGLAGYIGFAAAVSLLNPIFVTSGSTSLFFVANRPYTLEALIYGGSNGLALAAAALWFRLLGEVCDAQRLTAALNLLEKNAARQLRFFR